MEILLRQTTAYKIISGDRLSGRLSHAYMLHFPDPKNLRAALKLFALEFFGFPKNSQSAHRILNESFTDFTIYPSVGEKITADGVAAIIAESSMRPVEGDKKLCVICGFEGASPLVQNKLLKTLEEPLNGVYFLLGVSAVAPVLDTVKSRVKALEIAPFSEEQIFAALQRKGQNPLNLSAARSANGVLGAAENMLDGDWFKTVAEAANEICSVTDAGKIGEVAAKHAETKYKQELLAEMQRLYFSALSGGGELCKKICPPALIYALEKLNAANADLKFNANFQGLLYDFMLGVVEENKKWLKLRA